MRNTNNYKLDLVLGMLHSKKNMYHFI